MPFELVPVGVPAVPLNISGATQTIHRAVGHVQGVMRDVVRNELRGNSSRDPAPRGDNAPPGPRLSYIQTRFRR